MLMVLSECSRFSRRTVAVVLFRSSFRYLCVCVWCVLADQHLSNANKIGCMLCSHSSLSFGSR